MSKRILFGISMLMAVMSACNVCGPFQKYDQRNNMINGDQIPASRA